MIKLVYYIRRRPDLGFEQFSDYWSGPHADLVRRHAQVLHIERYVQSHAMHPEINAVLASRRVPTHPFDGIAELYFRDAEAMMAPLTSEAAAAAQREIAEDEANFVDSANSHAFVTVEQVIVAGEA